VATLTLPSISLLTGVNPTDPSTSATIVRGSGRVGGEGSTKEGSQ
jgi:hypothetical protein